jgi:transcriptional regulator GlxA family with amidase domain
MTLSAGAANDAASVLDPRITRALDALRCAIATRWTVARLAKVAGMSRAAFANRFAREVGVSPLKHLADLRMWKAAGRLRTTSEKLVEIADHVGYANGFALSRAFVRRFGVPPGVYRKHARVGAPLAIRGLAA